MGIPYDRSGARGLQRAKHSGPGATCGRADESGTLLGGGHHRLGRLARSVLRDGRGDRHHVHDGRQQVHGPARSGRTPAVRVLSAPTTQRRRVRRTQSVGGFALLPVARPGRIQLQQRPRQRVLAVDGEAGLEGARATVENRQGRAVQSMERNHEGTFLETSRNTYAVVSSSSCTPSSNMYMLIWILQT